MPTWYSQSRRLAGQGLVVVLRSLPRLPKAGKVQTDISSPSFEDSVDAKVRLIDLFVDSLDINPMGLKWILQTTCHRQTGGRPAYDPGDLLKLFFTKRGIDRASADVGFMFTAYNLNLIDKKALKAYLSEGAHPLFLSLFGPYRGLFKPPGHLENFVPCP